MRWADYYTRKAKEENWLARSVYKLQEIDKRVNLIKKGDKVLDMGCYPGSWSQYCLKKVGKKGFVTGIDVKEPERLKAENFLFIKADIFKLDPVWLKEKIGIQDVLLSDMAPNTTGIDNVDVIRSLALANRAFEFVFYLLKKGGNFVCKVFEGEGFIDFRKKVSLYFDKTRLIKPKSTRKNSREIFIIGIGKK